MGAAKAGALTVLLVIVHAAAIGGQPNQLGIVRVSGPRFYEGDCRDFVFTGTNIWQLLEASAGLVGPDVYMQLDTIQRLGLNVVRFFPFSTRNGFQLQTNPGVYNPTALDALDRIVAEAEKRNLRLIMPFSSYYDPVEGPSRYVNWAGLLFPDDFYSNDTAKQLYKNHIQYLVNRRNGITRRLYKDEPAIFSWELMNEPRASCDIFHRNASCEAGVQQTIDRWIGEVADFLKTQDPNHLVTVGEEGFYGFTSPDRAAKINANADQTTWSLRTGQDFIPNHSHKSIDYASIHIWPDNWQANETFCNTGNPSCGPNFVSNWLEAHKEDAASLGKALVVGEFGKQLGGAEPYFRVVYDSYSNSTARGENLRGIAYWGVGVTDEVVREVISPGAAATQAYLANLSSNICPGGQQPSRPSVSSGPSAGTPPGPPGVIASPFFNLTGPGGIISSFSSERPSPPGRRRH